MVETFYSVFGSSGGAGACAELTVLRYKDNPKHLVIGVFDLEGAYIPLDYESVHDLVTVLSDWLNGRIR